MTIHQTQALNWQHLHETAVPEDKFNRVNAKAAAAGEAWTAADRTMTFHLSFALSHVRPERTLKVKGYWLMN